MKIRDSIFVTALTLAATIQFAFADDGHEHDKQVSFGSPGKEAEVVRTLAVHAADDMRFSPDKIEVKQGETIKFVITNDGKLRHEFALGDRASQRAHALMMKKMTHMKHDNDAATLTLAPGETGTVIWKFDKQPAGPLEVACHEPGHYEAGMKISMTLNK